MLVVDHAAFLITSSDERFLEGELYIGRFSTRDSLDICIGSKSCRSIVRLGVKLMYSGRGYKYTVVGTGLKEK